MIVADPPIQLFLFLFSLHVIFHVAAPATVNTFCPSSDSNFTTNSTYQSNLNQLLSTLPEAGSATGFSLATKGQAPDQVFGRVLCRGDKLANYCLSCFRNASEEILTDCAPRERALIYYNDCILGYSDTNSTNSDEFLVFYNVNSVSDVQTFEDVYDNLMGSLTAKAANSSRMFSVGEANYTNNITLYGLVQCMRDMSADECYTCLQYYIQYFKSNYAGKQGVRVYAYQCFFQMEIYLFFDSSFIAAPPPHQFSPLPADKNATSSKSNKGEIACSNYT